MCYHDALVSIILLMKKPVLSQLEASKSPRVGVLASLRNRARKILGIAGFAALSSVAGCALTTDVDWQQFRGRTDGSSDTDAGIPDTDSGPADAGDVRDADSGPAPCLPVGDILVSGDNIVNLSDSPRSSVGMEIAFMGNCDALGGTDLAVDVNDGRTTRQNVRVVQVDNVAHVIRGRLDLSTIVPERADVSLATDMAGSAVNGRFNVDFVAPVGSNVMQGSLGNVGPYGFRARFDARGRLIADFLQDTDERISLVTHGDTTTACTTRTETSDCSMPAPDGSSRTQACAVSRTPALPVPSRVCDISQGRIFEYMTPGVDTSFIIHDRDATTLRAAVPTGSFFKLRLTFIDDAGNAWINIYRVPR